MMVKGSIGVPGFVIVAAGGEHTCALGGPGDYVECWGKNNLGQLGDNTYYDSKTPVSVVGLSGGVTALAAGASHTCVLLSDGTVQCWGDNFYGQLGYGAAGPGSTRPQTVQALSEVTAIAAGSTHTCALLSSGTVQCWGSETYGQLGNGIASLNNLTSTKPVSVQGLGGVTAIAAGDGYTCALLWGGTVQCWGDNAVGQLGNPQLKPQPTPQTVPGLNGVTAIATGDAHTCALISGGTVQCWGDNTYGQLGIGVVGGNSSMPTNVVGPSGVVAIAAGGAHTCALLSSGTVECWGEDTLGKLGIGKDGVVIPNPLAVQSLP
jgi:alpha-tubulin suppressor-like RCC1 family protein